MSVSAREGPLHTELSGTQRGTPTLVRLASRRDSVLAKVDRKRPPLGSNYCQSERDEAPVRSGREAGLWNISPVCGSGTGAKVMSSNDKADDDSLVEGSNYSGELLKEVLTNWRDAESQFRKTITLIIIIAVVFELLTRGGGAELTFSFIRVTDLRLVDIYIPVVVAYLTYNLHSLFSDLDYYENRVSSMLRVLSKEADAPYLATPPSARKSCCINTTRTWHFEVGSSNGRSFGLRSICFRAVGREVWRGKLGILAERSTQSSSMCDGGIDTDLHFGR